MHENREKRTSLERNLRSTRRKHPFDPLSFRSAREFESIDVKFETFPWEISAVHGRRNVTKIIVIPIRNPSISPRLDRAMATLIDRQLSVSQANSLNHSTRAKHIHPFERLRPPLSHTNRVRVKDVDGRRTESRGSSI